MMALLSSARCRLHPPDPDPPARPRHPGGGRGAGVPLRHGGGRAVLREVVPQRQGVLPAHSQRQPAHCGLPAARVGGGCESVTGREEPVSLSTFTFQERRSTETRIVLNRVQLNSEGSYLCEVSGEAPLFQTAKNENYLSVVGEEREGEGRMLVVMFPIFQTCQTKVL